MGGGEFLKIQNKWKRKRKEEKEEDKEKKENNGKSFEQSKRHSDISKILIMKNILLKIQTKTKKKKKKQW